MVQSLEQLVVQVIEAGASDLILMVGEPPIMKQGGKVVRLTTAAPLAAAAVEGYLASLATPEQIKRFQQDRQLDLAYMNAEGERFRVNVFFQRNLPSLVLRHIPAKIRSLAELGLPPIFSELIQHDSGLVLLVGPTGSGKSTTMAAMVRQVNETQERHIITLEDPIEYMHHSMRSIIQQREVGMDVHSFAEGLRVALREAPDVILLGEMRDYESTAAAITVAETGHLVLSTIHANSATQTPDRIIDMFPEGAKTQTRLQLADLLIAVVSQRLVPRIDGGLEVVCEVMIANTAVRNAIRGANTNQLPNIIQTGKGEGMQLLDDELVRRVQSSTIQPEVALQYANDPVMMRRQLYGY
jgi:twitching motility protein PilT